MINFKTNDDKENLERKLNHVLDMGEKFIMMYAHITCTERVALLLALSAAVKQVNSNIQIVCSQLRGNLIDTFKIDYTDYARKIEDLLKIWKEDLAGVPMIYNLDTLSLPTTNAQEIVFKEDTFYDIGLESEQFDFYQMRIGLIDNYHVMCEAVENGLEQISSKLRRIVEDYTELKKDPTMQDRKLAEMRSQYMTAMWKEDEKRLKSEVKEYIHLCGKDNIETYKMFRERLARKATDPHDNKALSELNECYLAKERPADFIVKNRNRLSVEDIAKHFRFERYYQLVCRQIEMFALLLSPENELKDLFVNQAAQELARLLAPTINMYVDFRHNYQYAALQMAMMDLELVHKDKRNGVLMMNHVNKYHLKNDPIKDQTTLTQWTGKLLGNTFGKLSEANLDDTNMSIVDYDKIKDIYWLCLSIINKIVQKDLTQEGFAECFQEEHPKTPAITDYKNSEGQSIMERLSELKSVIKKESIFS